VFLPAFRASEVAASLNEIELAILVFSTLCIAASGYIINDILDYEIDKINKPDSMIVGKHISIQQAHFFYWASVLVGFIISIYLAIKTNNLPLLSLYPIAVFLLYLYSKYLKKSLLAGNIIVALFCAFVAGIVWVAEQNSIIDLANKEASKANYLIFILTIYLLFAFLSTMFREIIKDIEDMEGDQLGNCKTLPILYGIQTAKIVASGFGVALLLLLFYLSQQLWSAANYMALVFVLLAIILPLFYALFKLVKAQQTQDFHHLSQVAKIIMLSGLILLFLIVNT